MVTPVQSRACQSDKASRLKPIARIVMKATSKGITVNQILPGQSRAKKYCIFVGFFMSERLSDTSVSIVRVARQQLGCANPYPCPECLNGPLSLQKPCPFEAIAIGGERALLRRCLEANGESLAE